MNTIRFASKDAFIAALEGRRAFWRAYDDRQTREHVAAEKKFLTDARARMREALKLDYNALVKGSGRYGSLSLGTVPECPVLQEPKIDNLLAALAYTQAKSFTVDSRGVWDVAHWLLTHDPDAKKTAC